MFPQIQWFKKRDYAYLALAMSVVAGGIAIANTSSAPSPLQNSMAAYVVGTNAEGNEYLQPASEVEPGQTVHYQLTYKNVGEEALKGITVTGPVPDATHYVAKSARTAADAKLQVSIDGGKSFESEPVKRVITNEAGERVEVTIPPKQYTHVRWVMKEALQAGAAENFAYRSKVK